MAKIIRDKPVQKLPPVSNPISPLSPTSKATAGEGELAWPTGNVTTKRPVSGAPYNIPWSQVSRWQDVFVAAAKEFVMDPLDLAVISIIESDSNQFTTGKTTGTKAQVVVNAHDGTGVPSYGMMQIKPQYHQWRVPDADAFTAIGNVRMAAALLATEATRLGGIEQALMTTYFPKNDPNGTTQKMYLDTRKSLLKEIDDASGITVIPGPSVVDPYRIIFNGDYPPVKYGFLDDVGIDSYDFVVNHGGTKNTQHSGDDVLVPYGTKLYAPAAGVVRCVGSSGSPDWGQSCGAYNDTGESGPSGARLGVGNITILLDSGYKLTLGHCRTATIRVGDRVKSGQQVGTSGGQDGAHCHVEVSVNRNGTYWLVNPRPALQAAIQNGGGVVDTRPMVMFEGAKRAVPLSVPFRKVILPAGQRNQRPGTRMVPDGLVIHETDNIRPGMDAAAHLRWLQNGAPNDNGVSQQVGFHFCIDDGELIQFVPLNEIAWHGGDGGGPCNMHRIGMELCVNDNNIYKDQTRANAEEASAAILLATDADVLEMHGTCCEEAHASSQCHYGCPKYIKADKYWPTFNAHVQTWMNSGSVSPLPTYANPVLPPEWDGDDKIVNGITFTALSRNFVTKVDNVPALQYADIHSSPVRDPLRKGEKFSVLYQVPGTDSKMWLVTKFGSRIPSELCSPAFTKQ
jgi:N-acetylmuramoyl-L-alanine amidase CwlA/murein DD-endopeptidase MepM/ murein hydrolase activator NlpD